MRVTVRLYGAPRVALRTKEREVTLPEGATVADLVQQLVDEMGPLARTYLVDSKGRGYGVAFVVDGEGALPDRRLSEGSIVALMPPTAGG